MIVELIPVLDILPRDPEITAAPYLAGSNMYLLNDLSDKNLIRCMQSATQMEDAVEKHYPICGGYILRIDGEDKFFPQCCGDLSDINYWQNLTIENLVYAQGHPKPIVDFSNNNVCFDFTLEDEYDEQFSPKPMDDHIVVSIPALKIAVDKVLPALEAFRQRLEHINITANLQIARVQDFIYSHPDF